jgi:multiple sugar transport system substrate-binding protein
MPKETMLGAVAIRVAAVAALACNMASAQTTINFLSAQNNDVFAPVIEAFEAAHPEYRVVHQSVPFNDLNTAVETRVGSGDSSIDVYAADTPRVPAFATKGYLLNLDDEVEAIEAAVPNPIEIDLVSHGGSVYAYPMWTSSQLLYFNRSLLDAAGLVHPDPSPENRLTWEQVVADAEAAQAAGATWGLMFQQVDRYYQLQPLFESSGAGSGLTGDDLLEPALTGEAWVETAEWYGKLFESGLAPRGVTPAQTDDLFQRGELAYFVGGPWALNRFDAVDGLDYGVAPMPFFEGGEQITPTGAWALGINPHAANLEGARKFAAFATLTAEGSYLTTVNFALMPTNAEGFERYQGRLAEMTDKVGPVLDIMVHEMANTAVVRPRSVGYVAFETEMNQAFSDIRNGGDAGEVLQQTESRLARLLARL